LQQEMQTALLWHLANMRFAGVWSQEVGSLFDAFGRKLVSVAIVIVQRKKKFNFRQIRRVR